MQDRRAELVGKPAMGRTEIQVGCMFGVRIHGQLDAPAEPAPTFLLLPAPSLVALNRPVGLAAAAYRDLQERSSSTSLFHGRQEIGLDSGRREAIPELARVKLARKRTADCRIEGVCSALERSDKCSIQAVHPGQ
jgi:hypothetical protein